MAIGGIVFGILLTVGVGVVLLVLYGRGIIGRWNITIVLFKQQHTSGVELSVFLYNTIQISCYFFKYVNNIQIFNAQMQPVIN